MKKEQPQHSVRIEIVNPNAIDSELLDRMNIDLGMRSLVSRLLSHGYDTAFSCEGHGVDEPYLAFRKGTGDGTIEKELSQFGLERKEQRLCCRNSSGKFCDKCGASKIYDVYSRPVNQPFSFQ